MRTAASALACLALAGPAMAQTGAVGPTQQGNGNTAAAGANARAADEQSKSFTTPTPAGASLLVSGAAQAESCAFPISAGVGTLTYGFTVVWAKTTTGCEHRRTAMDMAMLGDIAAAKAELCELPDAKAAYAAVGRPCP